MSEKWKIPRPTILLLLEPIACIIAVMSTPRFVYIYPESSCYLDIVALIGFQNSLESSISLHQMNP